MRQLGNAVPVVLAETVLKSVANHLQLSAARKEMDLQLKQMMEEAPHA